MVVGEPNGFAVATGKRLGLVGVSIAVNRAYGVDHVLRGEAPAGGEDSFACGKLADFSGNLFALFQDGGTAGTVNGTIDASATYEIRIGSVHDGVGGFFRDVSGSVEVEKLVAFKGDPHSEVMHANVSGSALFGEGLHAGKFLALEEFQGRSAASGDVRDFVGDPSCTHG